jgi:Natural resistance-associated macrophage protein
MPRPRGLPKTGGRTKGVPNKPKPEILPPGSPEAIYEAEVARAVVIAPQEHLNVRTPKAVMLDAMVRFENHGVAAYPMGAHCQVTAEALLLSVGIIGATVMPHAVYLHSGLTQARMPVHNDKERRKVLRFSNQEVIIALAVAGLVNMAMVMMASSAFHAGHSDVAEIETAYHTLTPLLGIGAAGVFLLSLIASASRARLSGQWRAR